ncbi:MAG: diguanylate cyclase, partial [Clostridia bacterium]
MKHKNLIVQILGIFFVIIIASAAVFSFSSQLNQSLIKETYKTLSEVSEHYNSSFLQRLSYDMKTMKVLAGSLAGMTDATKQDIMDILQNAVDDGEFTRMVVSNASGTTYSNTGVSINISEREYFQKAMRGESDVSQPLTSVVEEEEIIIVAVPIQIKGRTIVGVLFGVYPLSIAGNMLLDSSYFSEGYGYIMSPTGNIILSSEHANRLCYEKNLLSFLEKANLKNFTVEEFQSAITKKESRSFTFTYEGKTRFVNFMPSTINDWYTVSVASDLLLVQKEKTTSLIVIQLVLTLIVSGIVLIILIVYNNRRHNKVVTMANERYASLIKNISGGVIVALGSTTIDGTIATYVSEGFTKITGYTLQDIQTLYNGRYLDIMYDADRQPSLNQHNEQIKVNNTYHVTYRLRKKDGSLIWVVDNGYLVQDIDGLFNHSIITDITAMKAQEEELRASDNRFSVAINSSSGTLFEVDMKKQLYTHFENAERIFGVSTDKLLEDTFSFSTLPYPEFINATTAYFFHPDDRSLSIQNMAKLEIDKKVSYEARIRRYDNSFIWAKIDLSLSVDEYGLPERLIGFMSDIDSVKKQAEQLKIQLQVDPMTGLCNKIAMATLSDKFLKENSTGRHALLAIDIDNFKGINDTLGHAFGDIVIIEISTKLKTLFDDSAILARMGGDEFAILMGNITDKSDVLKKATELSSAFRQTYLGNKDNYKISCSIGIIMIDNSNESFDTLYRKVDAALYQAKRNGKDQFVFYKEEESSKYFIESRHTTDEQLQNLTVSHDIESHIFELMYASK